MAQPMPRTMVLSRNFLDNTIVRGIGWAVQSIPTLGVTSIAVTVTIARGRWYCCWPEEPASNSSETTCRKHNALNDEALSHLKQLLAVKITFVTNADPSKAKPRFPAKTRQSKRKENISPATWNEPSAQPGVCRTWSAFASLFDL